MVVDRLARGGLRRLLVVGALLAVAGVIGTGGPLPGAGPPGAGPLTAEQKARLKERDRAFAEMARLRKAGKLAEAVAALGKVLVIERAVFGKVHVEVAGSLALLARLQEQREDFTAARKACAEVVAIHTRLHGATDWRTRDARWELDGLARRARLGPAGRKELAQAGGLKQRADALYGQGRYREALPLAQKVAEVHKRLLTEGHPAYAQSLNSLAWLYRATGDYRSALPLFRRALDLRRRLLTEDHPAYAQSLNDLAGLYRAAGDYRSALPLYRRALELRRRLLTEGHPDYAQGLNNLGLLYRDLGNYRAALPLLRQALDLTRKLQTEEHPDYAASLNNLALLYRDMGEYRTALPLFRQARDLYKRLLTEEHPDYATSLNNLALLYQGMEDYRAALPLHRRALELRRKLLTEDHPACATSLNNLAGVYQALGDYRAALPLYRRALELRRKLLTEDHPACATSLNNLAGVYQALGDYRAALPLYRRALELRRKLLTEDHPEYAESLSSLVQLYRDVGDYRAALPLYQQARDLRRKFLAEDRPRPAASLIALARLYQDVGDYRAALPLLERARDLVKEHLTEEHPAYADSLASLGLLYLDLRDSRAALPLLRRALDLRRKLLTESHRLYADSLNNLAAAYLVAGDGRAALPLLRQARDLTKKLRTEDHPRYARALNNLAWGYKSAGDYRAALPLFQQACDLLKKLRTEEHPDYATGLNNLALLYQDLGDYRAALPLLRRSCDLNGKLLTEGHPRYADGLTSLAVILHCLGKAGEGLPLARQGLALEERLLDDTYATLSDRQRLDFAREHRAPLYVFLSLAQAAGAPAAEVHPAVLAAKGRLAGRQAEEQLARDQPALNPLVEDLRQARAGLARLSRQTPATPEQQKDWRRRFDDLERDKERLEALLARKSAAFRRFRQLRAATAREVADALPDRTAFLDFLFYNHFTPPPGGKGPLRKEARLLAFVLARGRAPALVPLGPAAPVEEAVAAWRRAVSENQSPDQPGRELSRRLWAPLVRHLGGADAALVAPDGALCGLPFAALPGGKPGTYLGEELAIGYVTSGRQLLELHADKGAPRGRGLLAVGGLAYGKPAAALPASAAFAPLNFEPLPGTRVEAERLARLYRAAFPKAEAPRQLGGTAADAARLKAELPPAAKASPRYLHLATHAFFEAPPPALKPRGKTPSAGQERQDRLLGRNPLLLSGLVLAGANESYARGILSAEEVSSLDLRGVEMAVLSACQTGLGRVDSGEGVLGLQRGFQMAGARSLAVSLWSVNDAATSVLMEEFYTNLWVKKLPRLKALQQAQLTVLRNPDRVLTRGRELGALLAGEGVSAKERAWLARRGIAKKVEELPDGGKVVERRRSPPAWWAGFVLYGDAQ